jgi:ubiquinone/menaquinone biosynthesis C-methylase UbiE
MSLMNQDADAPASSENTPSSGERGRYKAQRDWQSHEAAAAYRQSRQPEKFKRYHLEDTIIGGWLERLTAGSLVVDIPCGTGRLIPTITRCGLRYLGADVSSAMIAEARQEAQGVPVFGFVNADAEHIPLADNSVDCVIVWRLLHHIREPRVRQAMLREAARVSRREVMVSFHHPLSFTAIRKACQRMLSGRDRSSGTVSHWRLRREAQACGLRLVETRSFKKYISINWFACFVKMAG